MEPEQIDYTFAPTSFGEAMVAASEKGICALFFAGSREMAVAELKKTFPKAELSVHRTPVLDKALSVFDGGDASGVPLDLRGTPFQMAVWCALTDIPRGTTVTYSEIAARAGYPLAYRAVGSAVGANPVSVIVPCHRVVPRTGGIGGYRWGGKVKAALLKYENY